MKNHRFLQFVGTCALTTFLVVCILAAAANLLESKDSRLKFAGFYDSEADFDVLFSGSSHVWNGISPMDMWEQNGIVAYNLATSGSRIPTAYWVLRNALEYTDPKLVVIDGCYLLDEKTNSNVYYNHRAFDAMPFGRLKIQAITDLYENKEDIQRYLFPFMLYHSRWEEFTLSEVINVKPMTTMGFAALMDVTDIERQRLISDTATDIDNVSVEYLKKMIELCQSREIDVLIIYVPFSADETSQNEAVFLRGIAEEYGVTYLDPELLSEQVNYETDFHNDMTNNSHLNISGAHKLSYYLGDYIAEHYDVEDRRDDPAYAQWDAYEQKYRDYKLANIQKLKVLNSYLMALSDKDFHAIVKIEDPTLYGDEKVAALLENIHVDVERMQAAEAVYVESGGAGVYYTDQSSTPIGKITWADNSAAVLADGQELYLWTELPTNAAIQILLIDPTTGAVLDVAAF